MLFRFALIIVLVLVIFLTFYLTIWRNIIKPRKGKDCCCSNDGCCSSAKTNQDLKETVKE